MRRVSNVRPMSIGARRYLQRAVRWSARNSCLKFCACFRYFLLLYFFIIIKKALEN